MQSARSVTARNFLGAFLGGLLGILAFGHIHPLALPVGVLLGVVAGWWYEDILVVAIRAYHTACYLLRAPSALWTIVLNSLRVVVVHVGTMIRNGFVVTRNEVLAVLRIIAWVAQCVGRAFWSLPSRFLTWAAHPVSQANMLTTVACLIFFAASMTSIAMLVPWPETHLTGHLGEVKREVPFGLMEIILISGFAASVLTGLGSIAVAGRGEGLQRFYSTWEQYDRGAIHFFLSEIVSVYRSAIAMTTCIVVAMSCWIVLGSAMIVIVVLPVATFVTFMIGLYKIMCRGAHWWCFGVTLVVTTIFAIAFYRSFNNELVLWSVALMAGITSGVITEGLRFLGVWWASTPSGQHYLVIWENEDKMLPFSIGVPVWRAMVRISDKGIDTAQRCALNMV